MNRGTVLVTGASSGIGEALARQFASEGFDLILTARREDRLTALADELAGPVKVTTIPADLATGEGIDKLQCDIEQRGIPVDILINNAGMMVQEPFVDLDETDLQQTIALNIIAVTRLTHHFLPGMISRRSGRILNVASVAAFHPVPGMDIYAATKAYVLSLTESLAENLRSQGVFLTALCPGITETDMVHDALAGTMPPLLVSKPADVAREGYQALMNREVICVPGGVNKLALTWAQHQPRWLVRGLGGLAAKFNPRGQRTSD